MIKGKDIYGLSQKEVINIIGPLCQEDMKKTGILASLSIAQFCLESGYGQSELAQNANNCFGMKTCLSNNNWTNSTWDGKSKYTKKTKEQELNKITGEVTTITIKADFRKYSSINDSISDHSAYLLNAKKDSKTYRYAGLQYETDYKKAAQLVKDGGYATDVEYVSKLCNIIEVYNLTKFDNIKVDKNTNTDSSTAKKEIEWYRVRKSWKDSKTQEGAYIILENAIKTADKNKDKGYKVYDYKGNLVYEPAKFPYLVLITAKNLKVYDKAGGKATGVIIHKNEIYTIVNEEKVGKSLSSETWGKLKSGAGWINLKSTKIYYNS